MIPRIFVDVEKEELLPDIIDLINDLDAGIAYGEESKPPELLRKAKYVLFYANSSEKLDELFSSFTGPEKIYYVSYDTWEKVLAFIGNLSADYSTEFMITKIPVIPLVSYAETLPGKRLEIQERDRYAASRGYITLLDYHKPSDVGIWLALYFLKRNHTKPGAFIPSFTTLRELPSRDTPFLIVDYQVMISMTVVLGRESVSIARARKSDLVVLEENIKKLLKWLK